MSTLTSIEWSVSKITQEACLGYYKNVRPSIVDLIFLLPKMHPRDGESGKMFNRSKCTSEGHCRGEALHFWFMTSI